MFKVTKAHWYDMWNTIIIAIKFWNEKKLTAIDCDNNEHFCLSWVKIVEENVLAIYKC